MVGIYSLFLLGVGTGGPGYLWTTLIPVAGMLLVAPVFGELDDVETPAALREG